MRYINQEALAGTFVTIFIIGIIGNLIVIYILFRKRKTWNITTTYLFNLSVADAVFVCTLPLWAQTYLSKFEWEFGLFLCKFVGTITSLNMYASIFFLTAMSVDRWIAVVHATTINTTRSSVVAKTMCIVVWVLAFLLSTPRLIFTSVQEYKPSNLTVSTRNNTTIPSVDVEPPPLVCSFAIPPHNKRFFMGLFEFSQVVVGFVIPMSVICICYIRIVVTVRKKLISKRVKKERVAILAAIIITAFFVCWLPLQLITLYSSLAGWWRLFNFEENFYWKVHPSFLCLAYANSCINPFIYAFTATNFKNNVKEVCGNNIQGCKESKGYRMTLAKGTRRTPLTPNKTCEPSPKRIQRYKTTKDSVEKSGYESNQSSSDDIYEPFHPPAKNPYHHELGARGPRECQHLAVEDTTSGIYYEYFSSPPVLGQRPVEVELKVTTRADIINHNNQPEISDTYPAEQSVICDQSNGEPV